MPIGLYSPKILKLFQDKTTDGATAKRASVRVPRLLSGSMGGAKRGALPSTTHGGSKRLTLKHFLCL